MNPSTEWREVVPVDESAKHERLGEVLREMQLRRARGRAPSRALHAKSNGNVVADFTVHGDLPEPARVGIFATAGSYRAYVRFSNGVGARQADAKPDVRGVAVKLLGVPGRKLIPGLENATTQDFLAIRAPATPFRTAEEFVGFLKAAESPALALPRVIAHFGLGRGVGLLRSLLKALNAPMPSVATTTYYSALPIRWGAHAVHFALRPDASSPAGEKSGRAPEFLRDELAARLRAGEVGYDFQVQFFRDEARTPIEDASVEWTPEAAPFVTLGRLVLRRQDLDSEQGRRRSEFIEQLSFDPWHAPEEFRPLGDMMRARNHAYRLSTQAREAAKEPEGTEVLE
jgi:hypothetical protein